MTLLKQQIRGSQIVCTDYIITYYNEFEKSFKNNFEIILRMLHFSVLVLDERSVI